MLPHLHHIAPLDPPLDQARQIAQFGGGQPREAPLSVVNVADAHEVRQASVHQKGVVGLHPDPRPVDFGAGTGIGVGHHGDEQVEEEEVEEEDECDEEEDAEGRVGGARGVVAVQEGEADLDQGQRGIPEGGVGEGLLEEGLLQALLVCYVGGRGGAGYHKEPDQEELEGHVVVDYTVQDGGEHANALPGSKELQGKHPAQEDG